MNDRKLSITIQLSDSDDYEGGNFILDRQYQQPDSKDLRTKGTILVFPSPIKHKVTPVTKGIRKSLVAWVEGPKWR
jgi:PKHD-type hydroxylase